MMTLLNYMINKKTELTTEERLKFLYGYNFRTINIHFLNTLHNLNAKKEMKKKEFAKEKLLYIVFLFK